MATGKSRSIQGLHARAYPSVRAANGLKQCVHSPICTGTRIHATLDGRLPFETPRSNLEKSLLLGAMYGMSREDLFRYAMKDVLTTEQINRYIGKTEMIEVDLSKIEERVWRAQAFDDLHATHGLHTVLHEDVWRTTVPNSSIQADFAVGSDQSVIHGINKERDMAIKIQVASSRNALLKEVETLEAQFGRLSGQQQTVIATKVAADTKADLAYSVISQRASDKRNAAYSRANAALAKAQAAAEKDFTTTLAKAQAARNNARAKANTRYSKELGEVQTTTGAIERRLEFAKEELASTLGSAASF